MSWSKYRPGAISIHLDRGGWAGVDASELNFSEVDFGGGGAFGWYSEAGRQVVVATPGRLCDLVQGHLAHKKTPPPRTLQ